MQGIFVKGLRPVSKKAVKAAVLTDPATVRIEGTAILSLDYDGPASELPAGRKVYFVGPDPYRARKYYGQLYRDAAGALVVK